LAILDPDSERTIRGIAVMLADPDEQVRETAIRLLVSAAHQHDSSHYRVVRAIRTLHASPSSFARAASVQILGTLGERARNEFPLLVKAAADSAALVRQAAAVAIGRHVLVTSAAADYGARRATAQSLLVRATSDASSEVRHVAIEALFGLMPSDPNVLLEVLRASVHDDVPTVRELARSLLTALGAERQAQDPEQRELPPRRSGNRR
jgi:HEAT repeat protein